MTNVTEKSEPNIVRYIHCKKCYDEVPIGGSPQEYSDYDVGYTPYGLEVWCNRHNERVIYHNLTDVWETLNTVRREGMNESPYPIIPVEEESFPQSLVRTMVRGVFIDPEVYWGEDFPEMKRKFNMDDFLRGYPEEDVA